MGEVKSGIYTMKPEKLDRIAQRHKLLVDLSGEMKCRSLAVASGHDVRGHRKHCA